MTHEDDEWSVLKLRTYSELERTPTTLHKLLHSFNQLQCSRCDSQASVHRDIRKLVSTVQKQQKCYIPLNYLWCHCGVINKLRTKGELIVEIMAQVCTSMRVGHFIVPLTMYNWSNLPLTDYNADCCEITTSYLYHPFRLIDRCDAKSMCFLQ